MLQCRCMLKRVQGYNTVIVFSTMSVSSLDTKQSQRTVSRQENSWRENPVFGDVVQRRDRVDEVKVMRVVRVAVVGRPGTADSEPVELCTTIERSWCGIGGRIHTLRRSSTLTSATAAPNRPSGARFTQAATRSPGYHFSVMTRCKNMHYSPPLEPPLIATRPGAAYLFLTRNSLCQ